MKALSQDSVSNDPEPRKRITSVETSFGTEPIARSTSMVNISWSWSGPQAREKAGKQVAVEYSHLIHTIVGGSQLPPGISSKYQSI